MNSIEKIWFDGEWLYGLGDDAKAYRQSLLWYKNLLKASEEERLEYEISTIGIHWPKLNEDVSFESFTYMEAVPSTLQRFFLEHPEINVINFAKDTEIEPSLLKKYINGWVDLSQEQKKQMLSHIQKLGYECNVETIEAMLEVLERSQELEILDMESFDEFLKSL